GGHAYGWVYPGPMGSVLTPLMVGIEASGGVFNACTLNGRCQEACPMGIPLPDLLRKLRIREHEQGLDARSARLGLALWGWFATRPRLYRWAADAAVRLLGLFGRRKGRFGWLPLARGWTEARDLPAPQGRTFAQAWRERQRGGGGGAR
ncbi:MAG: lactate utilization protein, partial [Gammaproteobacteria bacterium]|nr:lactate utilization protein [Gammaproteobacteria bacterium]